MGVLKMATFFSNVPANVNADSITIADNFLNSLKSSEIGFQDVVSASLKQMVEESLASGLINCSADEMFKDFNKQIDLFYKYKKEEKEALA